MSIANPFSIKYGDREIGGTSSRYQLSGPYVINKGYDSFQLVTEVVVVATSSATLQSYSEALEDDFRKRLADGDTVKINLGSNSWTYTVGSTILKVRSTITKSGNPDTDRGNSRAYSVTIEGELPADDSADAGLRDIEVSVSADASRRHTVTFQGVYTATSSGSAKDNYESNGDTRCTDYLDVVDSAATWELVDERYTLDREGDGSTPSPHVLTFSRQYVQLLANQVESSLDDPAIKDHRITFTDVGQYPGDSKEDASRLRRVVGSYDCAVDVGESTDLRSVYEDSVKPHMRALFQTNYNPSQFAVEEERASIDPTSNRISVSLSFVYQASGGEALVMVTQSLTYRENRTIDYTPTHESDEYSAFADVGFATLERIWTRTATVLGTDSPRLRLREKSGGSGQLGPFSDTIGGETGPDSRQTDQVNEDGWNTIASTSQVTPMFYGNPQDSDRIEMTAISETVVERFHKKPGSRTSVPIQNNPST